MDLHCMIIPVNQDLEYKFVARFEIIQYMTASLIQENTVIRFLVNRRQTKQFNIINNLKGISALKPHQPKLAPLCKIACLILPNNSNLSRLHVQSQFR